MNKLVVIFCLISFPVLAQIKMSDCAGDYPLLDRSGFCHNCYEDIPIEADFENCQKCPNRQMLHNMCALKDCPIDKPMQGIYGYCYPCYGQDLSYVEMTEEECNRCPNRKFKEGKCL